MGTYPPGGWCPRAGCAALMWPGPASCLADRQAMPAAGFFFVSPHWQLAVASSLWPGQPLHPHRPPRAALLPPCAGAYAQPYAQPGYQQPYYPPPAAGGAYATAPGAYAAAGAPAGYPQASAAAGYPPAGTV